MDASVIIPIGNRISYLSQALQSVHDDIKNERAEILLIGEESSIQRAKRVIPRIKNLNLIVNPARGTVSSNLNLGIKLLSGDIVFRMDSDDIWLRDRFKKQVADLANKEYPISIGRARHISSNGFPLPKLISSSRKEIYDPNVLFISNNITHPCVAYTREWIESRNYPNSQFEDWGLWLKERKSLENLQILDFNAIKYRVHSNQISRKIELNPDDPIVDIWLESLQEDFFYQPSITNPVDFLQRNINSTNVNEIVKTLVELSEILVGAGTSEKMIKSYVQRISPFLFMHSASKIKPDFLLLYKAFIRAIVLKVSHE